MNQSQINQFFEDTQGVECLIIGDLMIDSYRWGNVNRISPEAPVPVVEVNSKENRLGGAANVAFNLKSLGAEPIVAGICGEDESGALLKNLLQQEGICDDGLVAFEGRKTTVKTRIIAGNQQLLRLDEEDISPLKTDEESTLYNQIESVLRKRSIQVIIFEDYNKGTISKNLITKVIQLSKELGIPTTVDPKKQFFNDYKGVTLFKPNKKELYEGLNLLHQPELSELPDLLKSWCKEQGIEKVLLTLSADGVILSTSNSHYHDPAHRRDIADVSGAGDTVIAVASLALALGVEDRWIAHLSNLAGGLVCEKLGVVPIDKNQLHQEALKVLID